MGEKRRRGREEQRKKQRTENDIAGFRGRKPGKASGERKS